MGECVRCESTETVEEHHLNYEEEETVELCRSCHRSVHANEDDPLYPQDPQNSPWKDRDSMRPYIEGGEELRPRVQDWAQQNGLTMAEAWSRILQAGLEAEGMEIHDTKDTD